MKTGTIIYVAGEEPRQGIRINTDELTRRYRIQSDRFEVITRETGHFDIQDAWRALITEGMQQVLCLMAVVDDEGELQLTGRQLRLCG